MSFLPEFSKILVIRLQLFSAVSLIFTCINRKEQFSLDRTGLIYKILVLADSMHLFHLLIIILTTYEVKVNVFEKNMNVKYIYKK